MSFRIALLIEYKKNTFFQSTLSQDQLSLIPDLEEDTSSIKPTPSVTSETLDRNIKGIFSNKSKF